MALHFSEAQIDEFKECFFFHARKGHISTDVDLSIIMRSLNFGVTKDEVSKYFIQAISDGKIDFASFLNILHEHTKVEKRQSELKAAFLAQDRKKAGTVNAEDMRRILTSMGEKLSNREVDALFREAGVQSGGQVNINKFVDTVMTPSPDY